MNYIIILKKTKRKLLLLQIICEILIKRKMNSSNQENNECFSSEDESASLNTTQTEGSNENVAEYSREIDTEPTNATQMVVEYNVCEVCSHKDKTVQFRNDFMTCDGCALIFSRKRPYYVTIKPHPCFVCFYYNDPIHRNHIPIDHAPYVLGFF